MNELLQHLGRGSELGLRPTHVPLGELLVGSGKIGANDLAHALHLQRGIDAPLGDIMVCEGLVSKADVLGALAQQTRADGADLDRTPPALEMATRLPVDLCLRFGVLPWREDATALYVATSSPADFTALRARLGPVGKPLFPVLVEDRQIAAHLRRLHGAELSEKAVTRVAAHESCRGWARQGKARLRVAIAVTGVLAALFLAAPAAGVALLALVASGLLLMTTVLKLAALVAYLTRDIPVERLAAMPPVRALRQLRTAVPAPRSGDMLVPVSAARADAALGLVGAARSFAGGRLPMINAGEGRFRLPRVSVLVPLLKEKEIAGQLVARLSRLTYPKSLLNVVLVLEESDSLTRDTIARTALPDWMSVIEVPEAGNLTTKPRALNYALDFCRGSIIGVWDAEDRPEPDQIERVVTRFNEAPRKTACLQGVLDYYNARTNWLTRCFTIEYATWWRVFLPGIARLGLVVPLGGTTLFFRREVLEELGGWDAHNVTEDADLGLRLARHGYVTELLPTQTHEEATSRIWPWVRQRSRWLKGFLITYLVHMRAPRQLLRDLGPLRFLGVQAMFFATFAQFTLAPVLWSFWMLLAGLGHPAREVLGSGTVHAMIGLFVFSEGLGIAAGLVAVSGRAHRHLAVFVPTMGLYFTLGTLAAFKALWELVCAPFYWDKTQHGVSKQTDQTG